MKHKKLMIQTDSVITKKQHKTPCSDCPWARKSIKGWLGSYTIQDWIQKVHSDVKIDCHTKKNESNQWQCAGSSIYRSNVCKISKDNSVLRLPSDKITVFGFDEFEKHHAIKK